MENNPIDWVTDFNEPITKPPRSRTLTLGLAAMFGGGGLTAVALLVTALTRAPEQEAGQAPTRAPTAAPTPTAVQTAEAPPSVLPAACDELFSESMAATLEQVGLELTTEYDGPWHAGSADAELRALLADAELDCHWTDQRAGLLTRVTEVADHEQALAVDRLESLGFTPLSEHGGVRYFVERSAATGVTGESHFFREGVWFATHWLGHGQSGYTADMVRSVFG